MSDLPTTSSPMPRTALTSSLREVTRSSLSVRMDSRPIAVGEIDIIVRGVRTLLLGGYQVAYGVIEVLEDALLGVGPVGRFGLSRANII